MAKRTLICLAALLLATPAVHAEQKVSDGGTGPAANPPKTQDSDKASAERDRREAARKALEALKGKKRDVSGKGEKPSGR